MRTLELLRLSKKNTLFSILIVALGCAQEKIDFNADDSGNVQSETFSDALFSESEDLTSVTVSSDNATGGKVGAGPKVISVADPRLSCAIVTLTPDISSTLLNPKGVLTIDFGTGCTDNNGNIRKGLISIAYQGRRFLPNSSVVTTLAGFEINGIKVEGTRTVTNDSTSTQANPVLETSMAGGKITWLDGTTTLRDEQTKREWKIGTTPDETQWFVSGSASGQNRKGVAYSMMITSRLVYKRSCADAYKVQIAVQGTKVLVVENKKISIDYGTGNCDRIVTVTVRSKSEQLEIPGNI